MEYTHTSFGQHDAENDFEPHSQPVISRGALSDDIVEALSQLRHLAQIRVEELRRETELGLRLEPTEFGYRIVDPNDLTPGYFRTVTVCTFELQATEAPV